MADTQRSDGDRELRGASVRYSGTPARRGAQSVDDAVDLGALVKRQVIPRLQGLRAPSLGLNAPGEAADRRPARPRGAIVERTTRSVEDEKAALIDRLLGNNIVGARATIETALRRGASLERVCLDLIQPVADRLQDKWQDDQIGLAEVTLAFLDLRSILTRLSDEGPVESDTAVIGRRVLLVAPRPAGDIGALAIAQMIGAAVYRRGGWDTWIEQDLTAAFRADTISRYGFDVVELFIGTDRDPDALAVSIRAIRRASPNPGLGIMLRGANFSEYPDFVERVGADLASPQPRASLMVATQFITFPTLGQESPARLPLSGGAPGRRRKIRLT